MRVLAAVHGETGSVAGELVSPYWDTCSRHWEQGCDCGQRWIGMGSHRWVDVAEVVERDDVTPEVLLDCVRDVLSAGPRIPGHAEVLADLIARIAEDFQLGEQLQRRMVLDDDGQPDERVSVVGDGT